MKSFFRLRSAASRLALLALFCHAGNARAQTVHGAGATFPAPVYAKWFDAYAKNHADVHVEYEAVGSEAGIRLLGEGKVDFAATDMPLTDEKTAALGRKVIHIATVLGGVVPIYNVAGLQRDLNFTPEILAGIYLGKITKWNDAAIRKANRGAALPDAGIVVIHRMEGSGTTYVWTDYLAKVSAEWKSTVGVGPAVKWPVGMEARGNDGVAGLVQGTPNSVGYVELIYAVENKLSFGAVRNVNGKYIQASLASVTAAAENLPAERQADFRPSITNAAGKNAYPVASFTWLLVPEEGLDTQKRAALLDLVRWVLTSGQKQCAALGYAALPESVASSELRTLDSLR